MNLVHPRHIEGDPEEARRHAAVMLNAINARIDSGEKIDALCLSLAAFASFKLVVPRNQYRKRNGSRFVNAYRGIPIELHDEWSWGWMARPFGAGA